MEGEEDSDYYHDSRSDFSTSQQQLIVDFSKSDYSGSKLIVDFNKSNRSIVDFDKSTDFNTSNRNNNNHNRSTGDLSFSQEFHRSQEFGRDRTLSTEADGSLSSVDNDDDSDRGSSSKGGNGGPSSSCRPKGQTLPSSNDSQGGQQSPAYTLITGSISNINTKYYVFPTILGRGHYGCVRECMHLKSKQLYAVKSIEKSKIGRLDHLQREVYLLSKINHKGLMKMVDIFEDVEHVHIITEIYSGGELFDKIIERKTLNGCFDEWSAATIVKSLLEAVAYLHRNGIVHRDIKPENILFVTKDDDDLSVKLIDFGLARRHRKGIDASMSNPVGTAYYMSPELLRGKYDQSCDVWSIGIVAYILLCGYPPFNGEDDPQIFETIKQGQFIFPNLAWDHVSSEAKDFIKCLLRNDPRKRFTADEALQHPWVNNLDRDNCKQHGKGFWSRKLNRKE
jgi:tRNA A-37 threonylcarbamoyl transferase component Bud32